VSGLVHHRTQPRQTIFMATYIAHRLIQGIVVLLVASMLCFIIFRYTGDPVVTMAGRYATVEQREEVRRSLGLDKPIHIQYVRFLINAAHGDFGKSYVTRVPALGLILERFPATFELATTAIIMAFLIGVSLGVVVALKPYAIRNRLIMAGSLGGISIPTFLTGILLIMAFAVYLGILPPFGRGETVQLGFWRSGLTLDGIKHLILPAFTLAMYQLAVLLRLTRAGMREVLTEEYIKTAWAKGLPPRKVIFKHGLRNALIPVVTITGLQFGELIAFSIVTETIFQWPGMGNLLLTSIYENDQPVVVTYIMLAALIIITMNIIVDILYAVINPKIRYE
jgi:ABC-type dipeptide/oligopeptide/nickel transport system permease component